MTRFFSKGKLEAMISANRESVVPQAGDRLLVIVDGELKEADASLLGGVASSTNLGYVATSTGGTVTSSTGSNAAIPLADGTNAGLLRPIDYTKLNAINSVGAFGAALLDDASAADGRTTLELGTAAVLNVGTGANNIVQLDSNAKLPAIDGSALTNLPSGFSDPMTTRGDLIYRNSSNVTARLPLGTAGQVLQSNGTDIVWSTISGSGDVVKVGTPADNQISVWTGNGTVEGTSNLTFDNTTRNLTIGASGALSFGAVNILSDNAGVTSLNNIDTLGTVTKTTIEATVELPNLQGILGVDKGGTGVSSYSVGDLLYATGATTLSKLGIGTAGQYLTTPDGSTLSWGVPAGAGDVLKVGTPSDNQVVVWTGNGTVEGTTSLTFNGATNTLDIGASGKYSVGGVLIVDDSSGVTTLKNIDGIDSVTEAAIEAAIDLPDLQGVLTATKGGTGQSSYATGDLLYATGSTTLGKLPIGTNGQVLRISGGAISWGTVTSSLQVLDEAVSLTANASSINFVGNGVTATNSGDAVTVTVSQAVTSVNSKTGAVVINPDDLSDSATTNKFVTAAEKSKLAGIESGADVTDAANVTAAGALMDSEVTSLSGIKSLVVPDNTTISAFGKTLIDDTDAATARTTLGLGTAATLNVGTSPNNVVQLNGAGRLPAVDGSLLLNLPSGFADPMTTRGDLIYRDSANNTTRLPLGSTGQVLSSNGTDIVWSSLGTAAALNVGTSANQIVQLDGSARLPAVDGSQLTNLPAGFADPMTTAGDIIIRNGSNTTTRLAIGSEGQVLKVSSGIPVWAAESGGGGLSVAIHSSSTLSPTVNTIYLLDATSNAITVTLPDSPASGSRIRFCDKAAKFATNNVTINRSGTNTIADGAITQLVLNRNYSYVELTYDNGNWSITGGNDFVDYLNSAITDEIQTVTYNSGGTSTLNSGAYNAFSLTANGASTTIAHSNVPASGRYVFELYLNWTAGTITWPTSWTLGDNVPTATGQYLITGVTYNGGTSFIILVAAL